MCSIAVSGVFSLSCQKSLHVKVLLSLSFFLVLANTLLYKTVLSKPASFCHRSTRLGVHSSSGHLGIPHVCAVGCARIPISMLRSVQMSIVEQSLFASSWWPSIHLLWKALGSASIHLQMSRIKSQPVLDAFGPSWLNTVRHASLLLMPNVNDPFVRSCSMRNNCNSLTMAKIPASLLQWEDWSWGWPGTMLTACTLWHVVWHWTTAAVEPFLMCGQNEPSLAPMALPLQMDSANTLLFVRAVTSWIIQLSFVSTAPSW